LLLIAGLSILRPLRSAHTELLWFLAIGAYYLAAAKSTAHQPLYYYHVVAVPPACLLIGRFVGTAVTAVVKNGFPFRSATVAGVLGTVALAALFELETYEVLAASLFGGVVIVIFLVLTSRGVSLQETPTWTVQLVASGIGTGAVIVLYIGTLVAAIRYDKFMIQGARRPSPLYLCAQEFAPQIQEDALILASGGVCRHPAGGPAAHNASYMFYWLDRKGFNICSENQSLQAVGEFIGQGVDYFVGEHGVMEKTPGFKDEVESQFEVAAECEDATLYRLRRAWLPDP